MIVKDNTKQKKFGHLQYGFTHNKIRHYQLFFKTQTPQGTNFDSIWVRGSIKPTYKNVYNLVSYLMKDNEQLIEF